MKKILSALLMLCFSTVVLADAAAAPKGPTLVSNVLMIGGFVVVIYFFMIRPQTKRAKEHQSLMASIVKDDEVITNGGLLGRVLRVTEQFIVIAIAEGIEVKVQKQAISATLPKGTMKSI